MSIISRPATRTSKVSTAGFMIGLTVFLALFSPTVNIFTTETNWLPVAFYSAMLFIVALAILLVKQTNYLPVAITGAVLLVASYAQGLVKGAGYGMAFYLAYIGITRYRETFLFSIMSIAVLNYIVMLGQLSGHFEALFSLVNYGNVAHPVSFLSVDSVPANYLPQIRPSGIFPTTTYISVFCILLFSMALFEKQSLNKYILAFIGSFFAVTGATIGLVLTVILAALLLRDVKKAVWSALGYLLTIVIYFAILPEIAGYNFSIADFENSVMNRVMEESILAINPGLFLLLVLIFCALILTGFFKVKEYPYLAAPLSLVFWPILLHNIVLSLMYSIMLGGAVGMLSSLLKWPRIVMRPVDHN